MLKSKFTHSWLCVTRLLKCITEWMCHWFIKPTLGCSYWPFVAWLKKYMLYIFVNSRGRVDTCNHVYVFRWASKTSTVWDHFDRKGDKVICKICYVVLINTAVVQIHCKIANTLPSMLSGRRRDAQWSKEITENLFNGSKIHFAHQWWRFSRAIQLHWAQLRNYEDILLPIDLKTVLMHLKHNLIAESYRPLKLTAGRYSQWTAIYQWCATTSISSGKLIQLSY